MAAHHRVDRLVAFFDSNKSQLDGPTDEICGLGDLPEKLRQFGWYTQVVDGHNVEEICDAVMRAKEHTGGPSAIVLNTEKGYGCPNALQLPTCHAVNYDTEKAKAVGAADIAYLQNRIDVLVEEGRRLQ